jgi:hypothetical protein
MRREQRDQGRQLASEKEVEESWRRPGPAQEKVDWRHRRHPRHAPAGNVADAWPKAGGAGTLMIRAAAADNSRHLATRTGKRMRMRYDTSYLLLSESATAILLHQGPIMAVSRETLPESCNPACNPPSQSSSFSIHAWLLRELSQECQHV